MLKIPSPLPDGVEQLMHDTMGCCINFNVSILPDAMSRKVL